MSVYLVEPLDTQFYRGTLPFDAGADGFATTEPLPWPSTLYGAWRTVGLVKSGHLHRNQVAAHKVWGDKHQRGSFTLKGPLLWCGRGAQEEILLPLPADLVATEDGKCRHCCPDLDLKLAACSDLHQHDPGLCRLRPVAHAQGGKLESKAGYFMSHEKLSSYLCQELHDASLNQTDFRSAEDLFHPEPRVGIKRSLRSHQAEDGMLYSARHYRFAAPGMAYWMHLNAGEGQHLGLPQEGVLKLGGEGRAARYRRMAPLTPLHSAAWASAAREKVVPLIARYGTFKLYLLTPGLFGGRAHPFQEMPEGIMLVLHSRMAATLVGLATYKAVLIGGWDMQQRFPKPLITGMAAGTVYFFALKNFSGSESHRQSLAEEIYDTLNFQSICSDELKKEGFGLVLVGGWYV